MLIPSCVCNLCRRHLQQNEAGLIDGLALISCGSVGRETERFRTSTVNVGEIHVCNYCWRGLQRAILRPPAPPPDDDSPCA